MIHKACNYLFVSGIMKHISQNSIPFTRKSEATVAVDFAISSAST